MDGTSMSAPNVAGATTLVSQYFIEKKYRSSISIKPSYSLLRSVLINVADHLDIEKVFPNTKTGFCSLNLGKYILTSVSKEGNDEKVLVGDHIEVIGDNHYVAFVDVEDTKTDLRITISYLDEVLNVDSSSALIIDLDLVVVGPDEDVYRSNQILDNSEESFSTNEKVIINNDQHKVGTYEIHVFSRIPDVVINRRGEFSISIFGPISTSRKEMIEFEKAKDCISVIKDNGKCNKETTLNECKFNGDESYTGHS